MLDHAIQLINEKETAAAIDFLNQQDDTAAVAQCYLDLAQTLYNKAKDVAASILMARAGMQYALASAAAESDAEKAYALQSKAKGIAYNLAANTWPGWDDPGITIDPTTIAIGMDAARTNLRLGEELNKGPLPLSRAHWAIGAHHMAQGNMAAARDSFTTAVRYAQEADSRADVLLNQGYSIMTEIVEAPSAKEAQARFEAIKAEVAPLEHGEFFVSQLNMGLRVMLERS